MKPIQLLSILLCLPFFFLFSCEPVEEPFVKQELTHLELLSVVAEMPSYQAYAKTSFEAMENILSRRKEITEKSFNWVANIHAKYPTLEKFRKEASEQVQLRYTDLTSIDVQSGDDVARMQFEEFLTALQATYIYQIEDLTEVLSTLQDQGKPEKTWGDCMSFCLLYANAEQQGLLVSCLDGQTDNPSVELTCRQDADFAFRYIFRGCTSGCPQDE